MKFTMYYSNGTRKKIMSFQNGFRFFGKLGTNYMVTHKENYPQEVT